MGVNISQRCEELGQEMNEMSNYLRVSFLHKFLSGNESADGFRATKISC